MKCCSFHPVQGESAFCYKSQSASANDSHALDLHLSFLPIVRVTNVVVLSLQYL